MFPAYYIKIHRSFAMSQLILVAYLLSCGSVIIGTQNYLAQASPSPSSSSSALSSSSSSQQQQQQQPEELVEQLMDINAQNDNNNNNNNYNYNDQTIYEQQQQQQRSPIYSYLRSGPSGSASIITPFSSTYLMAPSGTNGNKNNLYLPSHNAFLSQSSRMGQMMGGTQMEPLDFDEINWGASNLMREGRAYKPKIMSTARGFGKRSNFAAFGTGNGLSSLFDATRLYHGNTAAPAANQRHVTYADLAAVSAASPSSSNNNNNNYAINNNLSGHGISSKYADWINQALARYPTLGKHVNSKYTDYNGDGIITSDEKYQSL